MNIYDLVAKSERSKKPLEFRSQQKKKESLRGDKASSLISEYLTMRQRRKKVKKLRVFLRTHPIELALPGGYFRGWIDAAGFFPRRWRITIDSSAAGVAF